MMIELPPELEPALKARANAQGVTVDGYVRVVVERDLKPAITASPLTPFETSRGACAQFGPAPSAEQIDENRAEMFRNFGDGF